MNFYDYKTVSYARPQAGGTTNNPMVSDTAQSVPSTLGKTFGSLVDRVFGGGTTSSNSNSSSIWGDLGNISGKMFGQMSGSLSDDPERRKYESALREAEAILGPQYQRAREQTMSEVDRNMVSRGFYGQAPGDAIRASTLTDLDMAYQAALGNYATNIMDRRAQMELQKYMFDKEMQEQRQQSKDKKSSAIWTGIGTALGGLFAGPAGAAIGTGIGKIVNSIFG